MEIVYVDEAQLISEQYLSETDESRQDNKAPRGGKYYNFVYSSLLQTHSPLFTCYLLYGM